MPFQQGFAVTGKAGRRF